MVWRKFVEAWGTLLRVCFFLKYKVVCWVAWLQRDPSQTSLRSLHHCSSGPNGRSQEMLRSVDYLNFNLEYMWSFDVHIPCYQLLWTVPHCMRLIQCLFARFNHITNKLTMCATFVLCLPYLHGGQHSFTNLAAIEAESERFHHIC